MRKPRRTRHSQGPVGMDGRLTLDLTATVTDLREALDRLAACCEAWGVAAAAQAKVMIIVEELYSNTIKYGYGGECGRPVRIGLSCGPLLELLYEDAAPAFDPLVAAAEPNASDDPDDHDIGGLGISLMLGLAESAAYDRAGDRNRLTLTIAAASEDGSATP